MKIALLGNAASIHVVLWANGLAARGHTIHLLSAHECLADGLRPAVRFWLLPYKTPGGYWINAARVRRLLQGIQPDLVHTHYATGYGLLGRRAGYRPSVLSVWGSDVMVFPHRAWWRRELVRTNLEWYNCVTANSRALTRCVNELIRRPIRMEVVPWGVDCSVFCPGKREQDPIFTIGTAKPLLSVYGMDRLLYAFAHAREKGLQPARLVIAGDGPVRADLQKLARRLRVAADVDFRGRVPHQQVPRLLNTFNVFAALSVSEGFGVSILEASASGLPVVVSDAGSLPELVDDGVTGFIIPGGDPELAAEAFLRLAREDSLRQSMGVAGRRLVEHQFSWTQTLRRMEQVYRTLA